MLSHGLLYCINGMMPYLKESDTSTTAIGSYGMESYGEEKVLRCCRTALYIVLTE